MPLSEDDHGTIEAFRMVIEDSVATDDRYGPAERDDRDDESTLVTRFEVAPSCWLEFAVCPPVPQIRVAFRTDRASKVEEVEQVVKESGESIEKLIGAGMREAGLDWDEPPVERYREAERWFHFATPLAIDGLYDLDLADARDKTLRMLEGYLIAFGPALAVEEAED